MSVNFAVNRSVASSIKTLDIEMEALAALRSAMQSPGLADALDRAIHVIANRRGRVIITGIGKSGHVARKIAATMRSTGTSALFLHPSEASHGDLGIIAETDIVLAITWSGETKELNDIIKYCERYGVMLIVATAFPDSRAGRAANICLPLPLVREACPNELAPTSSTTVQLVMGDALAVALIEARGFSSTDFHRLHPGGQLGAQLCTVSEVMGVGDAIPKVGREATLMNATLEMSRKRYGCTAVVDDNNKLIGAFTDGDLRRCIAVHNLTDTIEQHMSVNPIAVDGSLLLQDALRIMNENAVSVLFVVDADELVGVVHMHDVVGANIG